MGKRSIRTHVEALQEFGVRFSEKNGLLHFQANSGELRGKKFTLREFSVTGTENVVMLASLAIGKTKVRLAATEPHVVDVCRFLKKMGAKISGAGTHVLVVEGVKKLKGARHEVIPDYLEVGVFTIAAIITGGRVTIKNIVPEDLEIFWSLLRKIGAKFVVKKNSVTVSRAKKLVSCERLQTAIHPGFPTDLQAPFVVLLTQCKGESLVHETLFEDRFRYIPELEKMGAHFDVLNPHQIIVSGPSILRGATVESCDIRAGAAVVLAALAARGTTTIRHIRYIDRGFERFDEKLRSIGAAIKRVH